MSCSQVLSAIPKDCESNIGGIKRVLLANADDVAAKTLTDEIITAITMASGKSFLEFNFRPNTGSLTSEYQVSDTGASNFVQSTLVMAFNRMETAKRVAVVALAQADLVAIVEDMNGKYWYLGYDDPVRLSAGAAPTGTARSDRNGYDVTLLDESKELPYEVNAGIIAGLLNPQSPNM